MIVADLTPSISHHLFEVGLLLGLLGAAGLGVAGVTARRDERISAAALLLGAVLLGAGFATLIVVAHYGTV